MLNSSLQDPNIEFHEKIQYVKSIFQMLRRRGIKQKPDKTSLKVTDDRLITIGGEKRSVRARNSRLFFRYENYLSVVLVLDYKNKKNALSSNLSAFKGLRLLAIKSSATVSSAQLTAGHSHHYLV
jgi:hypothetical protein